MKYPVNFISIPQGFSSKHKGIDFGWYSPLHHHQPILAVDNGTVIYKKYQTTGGNVVHIQHDGYVSEYGHMQDVCVNVGDKVFIGTQIGKMGATGKVTGEHLHFGLCKGDKITYTSKDKWVNPMEHLEVYSNQVVGTKAQKEYGNKIKYHNESYDKGVYVTLYNMNIRTAPNGKRVRVKDCTEAMKKALTSKKPYSYAVVKKGTNFTCLDVIERQGYWAKNYSGYICIKAGKKEYCKKV